LAQISAKTHGAVGAIRGSKFRNDHKGFRILPRYLKNHRGANSLPAVGGASAHGLKPANIFEKV
jgi:hypothetical protein